MSFRFYPDAEAELTESIQYYEKAQPGLGQDFALEIYASIQRAVAHPAAWPLLEEDIRRVLVQRFPYGVLYSVEEQGLLIVAVMHLHRSPSYWRGRL